MVAAALVRAGEGQGRVSSERAGCFGLEGGRPVAALANQTPQGALSLLR